VTGARERRVLHVLPHPGGGAETYIDLLEGLEGFSHRRIALSVTRSRFRGVSSVLARRRQVVRLARETDLIHLHGDMAAMIAAPALRGRRLVITSHGLHRLRRSGGVAGRVVRRRLGAAVAASARTICNAADERRDLVAALPGSLHDRLVVVPNGVPLPTPADPAERQRARAELGVEPDRTAVLFAAQLEPRKDPLGAIAAAEAAGRRGARLTLLVAGSGPLEPEVRARASENVHALGHRDDIERLLVAADVFLLPSHREGMSLGLLEAMAHGVAPLVADGPGNRETVGEAGLVFAAGDRETMAERLVALAADEDARERIGAAARQRIETEFSLERFLAGTRAQYEAALAG